MRPALLFETTQWENVSELQHSDHCALCFVSQQRPRRDFWIPNQLRHNYTANIIISQHLISITLNTVRLSGVGGENRTHFHGFAIQCLSNWLHLHNSGTACRNRTHIRTLEECCPIRWTNAVNLVRVAGLEPACISAADFKSAVYTIPPHSHISIMPQTILHVNILVPRVRFELTEFLLLRETTFPICPSGHKNAD
jgi:hypothetical protein